MRNIPINEVETICELFRRKYFIVSCILMEDEIVKFKIPFSKGYFEFQRYEPRFVIYRCRYIQSDLLAFHTTKIGGRQVEKWSVKTECYPVQGTNIKILHRILLLGNIPLFPLLEHG